jgi:ATP-dependent RNA helicase SUPV3L1/SUV3
MVAREGRVVSIFGTTGFDSPPSCAVRRHSRCWGQMNGSHRHPVTAVLGPTNTGKTHLAVERMAAHSSGMIGFPLRLLAREVYDRVVAMKGPKEVALLTGEERIVPPGARWFLCTAESMPTDKDLSFVAIDEAQLGADPERGHVFTDRLLHARGRDETMILGSSALKPMIRALLPDAQIESRPRFSTLSYAGAKKLSRLPKRSVIVAFSAEEVYAVAEAIRRMRGGAAVVMGALSPRTRNAQVAMFQAGEVDYLVATDAIGMGLNMDVAHVAFAGLNKFDGRRQRRLTIAEMAQIAGRGGRHQRDGTFGALTEDGPNAFTPEEIMAIEGHHIPRLDFLYWREGSPDFASIDALIASLEKRPHGVELRAAPEATDLAVLKRLGCEPWVRDRCRHPAMVRRLWAACGLPDFRKSGSEMHSRLIARIFGHLSEGAGVIPQDWFAAELARLDQVQGDVETIAGRITGVRIWAYIAHRADWLADPQHWAGRTRDVEARLSDALHDRLTQRFVDRRTTMLLRQIGADPDLLPVEIVADGAVEVEGHAIGRIEGFRFVVAPDARLADKKMLLAAAEKRLHKEFAHRAGLVADAKDDAFGVIAKDGVPVMVWQGSVIAILKPGGSLARPRIVPDASVAALTPVSRDKVVARIEAWLASANRKRAPWLAKLEAISLDPDAPPPLRAVAAALADAGGMTPREPLADAVAALDPASRRRLRQAGVTIGSLDLFAPALLKPGPLEWRSVLLAARGSALPVLPPPGATILARGHHAAPAGFRAIGTQLVRIDLIERIARAAHDARKGRTPFAPDPALATSIGLSEDGQARLMVLLGFRTAKPHDGARRWAWNGRPVAPKRAAPPPRPGNAFAALAELKAAHGK